MKTSALFTAACLLIASGAANAITPDFPTLPSEGKPPERTEPLFIYFEGPAKPVLGDPLWTLNNTRFQIRFDTRLTSNWYTNPAWAANNFAGDHPWPGGGFRPFSTPEEFADQVVYTLKHLYDNVPQWPIGKPKRHAFELIGPNAASSPWRDHDNPYDYIAYGGAANRLELSIATASALDQSITSVPGTFQTLGGPQWVADHYYVAGNIITGGRWRWKCIGEGKSGQGAPNWDDPQTINREEIIFDGAATWQRIPFDAVFITGFTKPANARVFIPTHTSADYSTAYLEKGLSAGGEPSQLVNEDDRTGVRINFLFGPDLWRTEGQDRSHQIAYDFFEAVKSRLDNVSPEELSPCISRTFEHYVEDDEASSDMKPTSSGWYNMPDWATEGYWQLNMADGRVSTDAVDGVYTVNELLDRANLVLNGGSALPAPDPASPYSPVQTTLRAWQWVNDRAIQRIMAEQRFEPFRDLFGPVPCGIYNRGHVGGDPTARLIIEPNGGEPSTGIAIDNYTGSDLWGISVPSMYHGVLGDYREFRTDLSTSPEPNTWSTEQNWSLYAQGLGYILQSPAGTINPDTSSPERAFEIGECALVEYGKAMKRNYGFDHMVMPALNLQYLPPTSDMTARNRTIARLANGLANAYKAGWIDRVWAYTPGYEDHQELRDAWYALSSQVLRLTTCPIDFDGSGGKTTDDIFVFLNLWFDQDPTTDWNHDGVVNYDDYLIFMNDWYGGC